jgi:hypothetical protein
LTLLRVIIFRSEDAQASCLSCLPGKYGNVTGLRTCFGCPPLQYQDQTRQTSCKECERGRFTPASSLSRGATTCQDCPGGYASIGCQACQAGQYRGSKDSVRSCLPCSVGRYQELGVAASCAPCLPGRYSEEIGAIRCVEFIIFTLISQ